MSNVKLTRVQSGLQGSETVILEHVKEGGLSGVVQSEEKNFCVFVDQTCDWKKG